MRIIAGEARGRRLAVLDGDDTRPTLERVKEGMFSAVQFWLPGAAVLDLYAGSGQLGLEALSRGAARCTFVDNNAAAVALIRKNLDSTGLAAKGRVVRGDAAAHLARGAERYDLILMDPPYHQNLFPGLLERTAGALGPGGILLCETEAGATMPEAVQAGDATLALEKQYRYGTVLVSRYRRAEEDDAPDTGPEEEE